MDGLGARLACNGDRTLVGGVDDFEALLVDLCHEHLVGLERVEEVAIVGCEVGQRVL